MMGSEFDSQQPTVLPAKPHDPEKRMSQVQITDPDLVEVAPPPKELVPVVHINQAEKAKLLFEAKSVIKKETVEKNEALLTAWANQKQLKRELICSLGVGDEVVMTNGQILVKERKRNRDLNEDQLVVPRRLSSCRSHPQGGERTSAVSIAGAKDI